MPPAPQTSARTLVAFFALTFAVTWSFFITAGTLTGLIPGALRMLVIMLGVFTPAMVALLFTARAEGSTGVLALLGRRAVTI